MKVVAGHANRTATQMCGIKYFCGIEYHNSGLAKIALVAFPTVPDPGQQLPLLVWILQSFRACYNHLHTASPDHVPRFVVLQSSLLRALLRGQLQRAVARDHRHVRGQTRHDLIPTRPDRFNYMMRVARPLRRRAHTRAANYPKKWVSRRVNELMLQGYWRLLRWAGYL